jgi:hypothetical protein
MITAVLILALGSAAVCYSGTPVEPKSVATTIGDYTKGRLYFPETEFDFGYVPQSSFVSHSFWLLNVGEDTLEVIQIKPG